MTNRFKQGSRKDSQGNNFTKGSLETYIQKQNTDGEFHFEKLWCRSFKKEASMIFWSEPMDYLVVGLEDGTVIPIEIDLENPMKYTELKDYKIHKGRVTGAFIDAERELMFTVGDDKFLKVFDFKTKTVLSSKCNLSKLN